MSKKDGTNLSVSKEKINFDSIWLISVNKVPRLRTRLVFKTVVGNKEMVVKSKMEISSNIVAFSKNTNFAIYLSKKVNNNLKNCV